jgi:hypothetical protein
MSRIKTVDKPPQDIRLFDDDDFAARLDGEGIRHIREIFNTPLVGSYNWDYDGISEKLRRLYELGKRFNWNAQTDIDWAQEYPKSESPMDPAFNTIAGFPAYEALSAEDKKKFAWRSLAQTLSQFLHGEQGALMVASQLVSCAPTYDAKLYAGSQTFDEARHVEVFNRYIRQRLGVMYPINPSLKALLDKVLSDPRWDLKFIGMQVIIEGLALAAFQTMEMTTRDPLLKDIVRLVMRDEGRHVAFGVNFLEDYVKELPQEEIEERAMFAYEACVVMRDRLFSTDVFAEFGFDVDEARRYTIDSHVNNAFRNFLFERIIPNLKRIGLMTEKVRPLYEELGILHYEDLTGDGLIDWAQLEKPLFKYREDGTQVVSAVSAAE